MYLNPMLANGRNHVTIKLYIMSETIKLGVEARDKVTGFKGIVIGRTQWLTGCDTYNLKPPVDKDGKIYDSEFFDVGQIEVIGAGISIEDVASDELGGPKRDHPSK